MSADAGPAAAIWIDIDHVKDFGDPEGHAAGDEQIRLIAAVIRAVAGDGSTYRADGDEFLVALPGATIDDAAQLARRIREAVEAETQLTISVGVASGADVYDAWARAEPRPGIAKMAGRNAVSVER
ncbi:MAG TPA: GGDEF domain-containing protein [Gaiellales bacterium]|nr:GGDEF domain-containing protein [Gaiellales bacterium]